MPARSKSDRILRCRKRPLSPRDVAAPEAVPLKIYFIFCETTYRVKCGIAADPKVRLIAFQVGSPTILRLLATFDGDQSRERRIHKRLTCFRVHGEWFEYCEPVRGIILEEIETSDLPRDARTQMQHRMPCIRSPPASSRILPHPPAFRSANRLNLLSMGACGENGSLFPVHMRVRARASGKQDKKHKCLFVCVEKLPILPTSQGEL
jgi:hypothetical protein